MKTSVKPMIIGKNVKKLAAVTNSVNHPRLLKGDCFMNH